MKNLTYRVARLVGLGAILFLPLLVLAANPPITKVEDIVAVVNKIGYWISVVFWIAAVAAMFYAGFLYLTAADDTERVKKAKKQLIYAVIAVAIGLMAPGIVFLVENILKAQ